jgi:hypothetical protein
MDDVLSLLAVSVGLLVVWWLCGPVSERGGWPGREGRGQGGDGDAHGDAHDRLLETKRKGFDLN